MSNIPKNKRINSIINALKFLNQFSDKQLDEIKLGLEDESKKKLLLDELQLQIKQGKLLQKIKLCNVNFDRKTVVDATSLVELNKIEKLISIEIRKDTLFKIINSKRLAVSREVILKIATAGSEKEIKQVLNEIPYSIRIHLSYEFKSKTFDFNSIIPLYTPMGNKR